jgi:inorganic pyrophosphatase
VRFVGVVDLPEIVTVRIEVPRGSFVKRKPDGRVDFVSPLPTPYNYGSIIGTLGTDGDPVDALVLGARLPWGVRWVGPVQACVGFVDNGQPDPKLVCAERPLSAEQRRDVATFFETYVWLKRALYVVRGRKGPTRTEGWLVPHG